MTDDQIERALNLWWWTNYIMVNGLLMIWWKVCDIPAAINALKDKQ